MKKTRFSFIFFRTAFKINLVFVSMIPLPQSGYASQVDSVEIISNPKIPPPGEIAFKEELTIGLPEGDENYMFGERVYFNVDNDGRIYVTDWDRKRIQKYGPDGKYLLTIGRKGQGPGEFQNVWEPEFDKDGNLYVVDIAAKRISFFSREGRFINQIGFPSIRVSGSAFINSRGYFLMHISEILKDDQGGSQIENIIGLFLYDNGFRLLAEFYRDLQSSKTSSGRGPDAVAQSWADSMSAMAFQPSAHYALGPEGDIFFGFSKTYEIKVFTPDGKPKRIIRKEHDPAPVTEQDQAAFAEIQKSEFLRFMPEGFESAKKKALALIRYPKYKPAFQDFTVADDGRLVVVAVTQGNSSSVLDIFDATGHYIAQTKAAIPAEGLCFKKGKAYAISTEDGFKSIKRYGLEIRQRQTIPRRRP